MGKRTKTFTELLVKYIEILPSGMDHIYCLPSVADVKTDQPGNTSVRRSTVSLLSESQVGVYGASGDACEDTRVFTP